MKHIFKHIGLFLFIIIVTPLIAHAHQPRITESQQTIVVDPEISKAYYGTLTNKPDAYIINASEPFELYVNLLVPDTKNQKKDVSAVIIKNGNEIAVLEASNVTWEKFYEPFGADWYWRGPEYTAQADAGTYEIIVWSSNNDSKYSLAIGKKEAFDFKETKNALRLIPQLKKDFFETSRLGFIKSPFGWGLVLILYIFAFITGFLYRLILKKIFPGTSRGLHKNIGKNDRIMRLIIAVLLLLWAMSTSWNPIIIFFSGFTLFEAIFSWCGFYAAIGKTTCPL
jgi:hypothetical protein